MLQSLVDFTIPGSKCTLLYKIASGEVRIKKYKKHANTTYFINGDVSYSKGEIKYNNIFKYCSTLNSVVRPIYVANIFLSPTDLFISIAIISFNIIKYD